MTLWDWLASPPAQRLAAVLLHVTWQGVTIGAVLLLAVRALDLRRAEARYVASLAALLALALCPVATWALLAKPPASAGAVTFATSSAVLATPASAANPWQSGLLAIWLAGVAFLTLRLAASAIGVLYLRWTSLPLASPWQRELAPVVARLAAVKLSAVRASEHLAEAVAVGLFQPLVLLPAAWLAELPPEVLRAVLAHELAHLRRGDLWINLLQRVLETLLFYHPVVWWLSRRITHERELCCDELAAEAVGDRLAYVSALELVARRQLVGTHPALATCIFGGEPMSLLNRVRYVLGVDGANTTSWRPLGLAAALAPAVLWLGVVGISSGPRGAVADDDRQEEQKDLVQKEGERKEGDSDLRREKVRKDADRPAEGRREIAEKVIRKDADRPAESKELANLIQELRGEVKQLRAQVMELQERLGQKKGERGEEARSDAAAKKAAIDKLERAQVSDAIAAKKKQLLAQLRELEAFESGKRSEGDKKPEFKKVSDAPRQDGDKKPDIKKDADVPRKEGDKKPEFKKVGDAPRQDGDRKPDVKKDADAPRKDVDKKPDVRKEEERKDGDAPRKEGERREERKAEVRLER